jgi:hypothetical protein
MAADQTDVLRAEAKTPHAVFHQFMLLVGSNSPDSYFLFFEGADDPAFYIGFILPRLHNRQYHEFVCNGRSGVIKVNELCSRDGRAFDRTLYFIDKDHSDLINPNEVLPSRLFQTDFYSFENYLVCQQTFRRFWSERLHLQSCDSRFDSYLELYNKLHQSFRKRMLFLMAIVLIGRGIDKHPVAKLNLNNVKMDKVLSIDLSSGRVRWAPNGGINFLAASNMIASGSAVRGDAIRSVVRKHLCSHQPKFYIRGKFELWFFVRFLCQVTNQLSNRRSASINGQPRATPGEVISHASAIDSLCALAPIPERLDSFLAINISTGGASTASMLRAGTP